MGTIYEELEIWSRKGKMKELLVMESPLRLMEEKEFLQP